jgi:hypothetical protein
MFPDSVCCILLGNIPEKEIVCNQGQIDLICTSLNRLFAYRRLTLPHTKRTETSRSGSQLSDWLLHRYSRNLQFAIADKRLRLEGRRSIPAEKFSCIKARQET